MYFQGVPFNIEDCYPPTLQGESIPAESAYFITNDAKRLVGEKCKRGHQLNARKLSAQQVYEILDAVMDALYAERSMAAPISFNGEIEKLFQQ